MQTTSLGQTGLTVSRLAIGGLFTSSLAGGVEETVRILNRAGELGINLIDTAPAYADSEEILGQALKQVSQRFQITTKLGGRPQPFDPQDAGALAASFHESLKLLGREQVEGLMIHEPDRPLQYPWYDSYEPLTGPVLTLLERWKQEGKIVYSGLAGTTTSELAGLIRRGPFDVVLTAFNYNALFREAAEEVLPSAQEKNMGVIVGSIYGQGFLGRRFDQEVAAHPIWLSGRRRQQLLALYELLDQAGITLPELSMRMVLAEPRISTILIGCKTVQHVESSVKFFEAGPLPIDVQSRLDEIAAMVPGRPFEEPMILPLGKNYYGPGMANLGAGIPVGKLANP